MNLPIHTISILSVLTFSTVVGQAQLIGLPDRQADIETGKQVAQLVEEQIGIYRSSPKTSEYLSALGAKLVRYCGDTNWNFSFQIADQPEPNAFAVPGGPIYVSRGLLALVTTEDELVGVLAHEIAHVTERHSARQQKRGFLPSLLSVPGNVVGGVLSEDLGNLINAPVGTLGGAWLSKYSRRHETESDRTGMRTAAAAGYDPAQLAAILQRLNDEVVSHTGSEQRFSFFDSHPLTDRRVRDIEKNLRKTTIGERSPIAADRNELYQKLDGMWWGENPENGVFEGTQFLHPLMGFTMTFPRGWKTANTPAQVYAVEPKGRAAIILGVERNENDPMRARTKFVSDMQKQARVSPSESFELNLGDEQAFVLVYVLSKGRSTTYLRVGWVKLGNSVFQVMALGTEEFREDLHRAATSLREMTETERNTVTGKRLRVIKAKANERVEEMSARTGNAWTADYTALVNAVSPNDRLAEGQLVKIVVVEKVVADN